MVAAARQDDGAVSAEALHRAVGVHLAPAGQAVEVLRSHRPPAMPISAVVPSGRLVPARVRVLLDALTALRHRGH